MRAYLTLFILVALSSGCLAGEIRKGATMQVKADSIWFEEADGLTRWQQLKKSGNAQAFETHQRELLASRDAWQFIKPQTVKVLGFRPWDNQVNVEMKTPGRMLGSKWFVDAEALVQ